MGRAPRRDLGQWNPADRPRDGVAILLAQNAIRAQDLPPVRNGRMSASPWTFYRGAAAVMAAELGSRPSRFTSTRSPAPLYAFFVVDDPEASLVTPAATAGVLPPELGVAQPRCPDSRRASAARVRTGLAADAIGITDMSQT